MPTPLAIDPSLQIKVPATLAVFKHAWLSRLSNAGLRLHHRLGRLRQPKEMLFQDLKIPHTNGRKSWAILIQRNDVRPNAPLLVYYHGGGFALTFAPVHFSLCEHYAREARCKVLMVDYRLTPRHPWPNGFDDCFDTLLWAKANHHEIGIDPKRIVVGGDSAGGALSAGVAQKARDRNIALQGQMLIYPMLQPDANTHSVRMYHDTPLWTSVVNRQAWKLYLSTAQHDSPPLYAAPGLCKNLDGLADCYLETAEFDPLHDEGQQYAKALLEAGGRIELNATKGTFHGYEMVQSSPLVAEAQVKRVAFLNRCFNASNR